MFVLSFDERTRDALVDTARTSTEGAISGTKSSDERRSLFLFSDDVSYDQVVGTTVDAPEETTTAVGDVNDFTSNTV